MPIRSSALPVLLVRVADRRILETSESVAALFGGAPQDLVGRDLHDFVGDAWSALEQVGAGDVDGYRRSGRSCVRVDGSRFTADLWLSAYTDPPRESAIGVVIPRGGLPRKAGTELAGTTRAGPTVGEPAADEDDPLLVVGTVDADWAIDRISADVQTLLGFAPRSVIGLSVLAGVHPLDVPALIAAAGDASADVASTSIRLRVLRADGTWQRCRAVLSPYGQDARPAFSFALASWGEASSKATGLADQVRLIAREVATAEASSGLTRMATAHVLPVLAELTSRELEIVARLLLGDRVPLIARTLFLGQSTVRNHLTSVYRKLGVSSQQELMTTLRSGRIQTGPGGSV